MPASTGTRSADTSTTNVFGIGVVVCGVFLVAGLTLADRVPRLFERARGRVEILDVVSVPGDAFTLGHFVAWAALAGVAAMATRRVKTQLAAAGTLAATSIALEVAQQVLTSTRSVELRDLLANLAGVVVGTTAGAVVSAIVRWGPWRRARWVL